MSRLTLYLFIFFTLVINAHGQVSSKGFSDFKGETLSRNERIALAEEFKSWSAKQNNLGSSADLEVWTVPIVFHVLQEGTPSISVFENAVNELNDAFSNRGNFNTPQGVDTSIQFCLVATAPDGGATTGVNHIPGDYQNTDMDLDHAGVISHSTKWDETRYLNVWLVNEITGEAVAYYEGKNWWTRIGVAGYASGDGVVVESVGAGLLAHEIGHYFGLKHTWEGMDCKNDDCLVDGDMVCDTPPDKSVSVPCGDNSCDTDVLSNFSNQTFFTDVPDMSSNFMDYSPCPIDFTWGQAERMRFTLERNFPSLFSRGTSHPLCELPCDDDASVQFFLDNEYPKPGENVLFTSELSGNSINPIYKWYVSEDDGEWTMNDNGSSEVSGSADLTYSFPQVGLFKVTLQVWDADNSSCFVSFSMNVDVSCGVDARFYPDKRLIASKQPHALFTDSVLFTNRSYGADTYEWVVSHQNFNPAYQSLPTFYSNETDLSYYFREPGNYQITLIARNGNCEDVSNTFPLRVDDPTIDGKPEISEVSCINEDAFQVAFTLYNYGYDTINVNTPVAFYDADPSQSTSANLLGVWNLPKIVYGFDKEDFSAFINADIRALSKIYIVFNDTGTTELPIEFPPGDLNQLSVNTVFPPSGYSELDYDNNYSTDTVSVEITSPIEVAYEVDQPTCAENADGAIRISVNGGSGVYKFAWDHDPELTSGSVIGLGSGNYRVEVSDVSSCDFEILEIFLESSPPMQVTFVQKNPSCPDTSDGELVAEVTGGVAPISYLWEDGNTTNTRTGLSSGTYSLTVTDSNGCVISAMGELAKVAPQVRMPTGFLPQDGLYLPVFNCGISFQLMIWNRWGQLVFSGSEGWDGRVNGEETAVGSFAYLLRYNYSQNGAIQQDEKRGAFVLIR
ncbi:M43 family zinc metalloprotease [Algoriphagus halophytocola]|uniref:M43 family zinc metalloprotease n=1 Tax=Algoriphagus halophytocola TaxID=2991499 RepID=A0ABY6MI97_9BACT|nr:M43 family zinc metalloprotease [Algoriphagus sp. TR-M5]UZD23507.1 M43 family zinc metalloprotease [Algoriphagus sp. TR-M5]